MEDRSFQIDMNESLLEWEIPFVVRSYSVDWGLVSPIPHRDILLLLIARPDFDFPGTIDHVLPDSEYIARSAGYSQEAGQWSYCASGRLRCKSSY
jgi:hypothetical protein